MSEKKNEAWRHSKENIRPVQGGRKTKVLKVALASHTEDVVPQQHSYEHELHTYSGDDPLSVWCKYIKWIELKVPKGSREGHIKQLIERCLSTLKNEKRYFDDDRFIDIMLKYAALGDKPIDVYNYMFSNKIGCKSAKFYISWSQELEQLDSLKKANEILIGGIQCKAEPLEKMLSYYKNFEMKFADKLKFYPDKNLLQSENSQSAFTVVKPQKKKIASTSKPDEIVIENRKVPLVCGRQQPQPQIINASGKLPFKVNNSENINHSFLPQSQFPIPYNLNSENFKENEPSKGNELTVKTHDHCFQASNTVKPTFTFYCDVEDEQKVHTQRAVPKTPEIPYTQSETFRPPVALFEPEDPLKKPMYPKSKVYQGTGEISLEEIRAAEWFDKRKKAEQENLLIEQKKKIEEQQKTEEELKKKVEYLAKQVKLLQSHSGPQFCQFPETAKLNTDINSLESINTGSCELNKLTEKIKINKDCENSTPYTCSDLQNSFKLQPTYPSSCSSNIKILSDSFENKDPGSAGFCDAVNMVQELYNRTLSHSIIEGDQMQTLTNELREKCSFNSSTNFSDLNEADQPEAMQRNVLKESNCNLPFTFYHDPTGLIIDSKEVASSKNSQDKEEDPFVSPNVSSEDIENIPPKDYIQESSKRELTGILQPSKNILFIPLEEQEEMEDNSDIEENYLCHNEMQYTYDTLILPSNTEQFRAAQFLSSTPYLPKNSSILEKSGHQSPSIKSNDASIAQHLPTKSTNATNKEHNQEDKIKTEFKVATEQNYVPGLSKMLSVIMETSAETYSKSSSSSSASSTRSNNLDQHTSNRISILKQNSKFETCEPTTLSSVLEVSHSISEMNCQNSSEISNKFNEIDLKVQLHTVDFDPFDQELNQKFLNSVSMNNYKNLYCINKSMKGIKEGENISIGNETYRIIALVAEGAYAKVFEAVKYAFVMDVDTKKFALKVCKHSDEWEFYICNELKKRLSEKKCMLDINNSIMNVICAEKFSNGIILVSNLGNLGTLLDIINFCKQQNSTLHELLVMYFTLEILIIVLSLHECNIIHGDIKPDNFLLTNNAFDRNPLEKITEVTSLQLIDFGRAIDLNFYNKGTCFTSVLKTAYFKCNEMKDKRPWVFQLDWYGVASCIHTMLFSDYMAVKKKNDVWGLERKLKRYWCTSLWDSLFNKLLNIPECYQEPDILSDISTIQLKLQKDSKAFLSNFDRFAKSYKTGK